MGSLKIVVAGVSGRATWIFNSLARYPHVELTGLCDPLLPRCEAARKGFNLGNVPGFDSVEKMLDQVDCNAVMVMSSDAHHAEVVIPALARGKRVFCEKPLETTIEKCRAIVEADEKVGGKTFVGFNLRYAPLYAKVKERILAGDVGRILTIQADEFYNGGRTYFRRWNRWRKESGGLWITKGSHDFDILCWLADAKPIEVQAFAARTHYVPKAGAGKQCRACKLAETCPDRVRLDPKNSGGNALLEAREKAGGEPWDLCLYNAGSDTFDHGMANIRFEGDLFASYTCNVVAGFSDRRIRVSGTKGTLDGSLHENKVALLRRDPSERVEYYLSGGAGGHGGADDNVLSSFFAFAEGRIEPKCRPREAMRPIAIGLAATRSGDEGRIVKIDEFPS